MILFYWAFIFVLILILLIVFMAWYSFAVSYNRKGTTKVIKLSEIKEEYKGYLTSDDTGKTALAFAIEDGSLYLTDDPEKWQYFVYKKGKGLVAVNNQNIVLAHFNDMLTLSPHQNSRYTQVCKIKGNNLQLNSNFAGLQQKVVLDMEDEKLVADTTSLTDFYFILQYN